MDENLVQSSQSEDEIIEEEEKEPTFLDYINAWLDYNNSMSGM